MVKMNEKLIEILQEKDLALFAFSAQLRLFAKAIDELEDEEIEGKFYELLELIEKKYQEFLDREVDD